MEDLSGFDLIVGILLSVYGVKGLFGGFFKELFGVLGLVAGVIMGANFARNVGDVIEHYVNMGNNTLVFVSGFFTVFFGTMVIAIILSNILSSLFKAAGLGPSEKIFGFAFSSIKIFTILSIVVYGLSNIAIVSSSLERFASKSMSYKIMKKYGERVVRVGNQNFDKIKEGTGLDKKLNIDLKFKRL